MIQTGKTAAEDRRLKAQEMAYALGINIYLDETTGRISQHGGPGMIEFLAPNNARPVKLDPEKNKE